ncbi:Uncharacterized protein APZ42_024330 [Daphnia magna]|uniref:Uncharacterized protein n=1 Tax=Daphnia magna TaxID=35525 RepID=A0A164UN97_9CRUS|nr:Uncharacterized protein APZ42_024330 [Daphnia magna]
MVSAQDACVIKLNLVETFTLNLQSVFHGFHFSFSRGESSIKRSALRLRSKLNLYFPGFAELPGTLSRKYGWV